VAPHPLFKAFVKAALQHREAPVEETPKKKTGKSSKSRKSGKKIGKSASLNGNGNGHGGSSSTGKKQATARVAAED
jgi:hypothetical protein